MRIEKRAIWLTSSNGVSAVPWSPLYTVVKSLPYNTLEFTKDARPFWIQKGFPPTTFYRLEKIVAKPQRITYIPRKEVWIVFEIAVRSLIKRPRWLSWIYPTKRVRVFKRVSCPQEVMLDAETELFSPGAECMYFESQLTPYECVRIHGAAKND